MRLVSDFIDYAFTYDAGSNPSQSGAWVSTGVYFPPALNVAHLDAPYFQYDPAAADPYARITYLVDGMVFNWAYWTFSAVAGRVDYSKVGTQQVSFVDNLNLDYAAIEHNTATTNVARFTWAEQVTAGTTNSLPMINYIKGTNPIRLMDVTHTSLFVPI